MQLLLENGWLILCFLVGLLLVTRLIMRRQSQHFCTLDVVVRKFSITDLQFAASPREVTNIINGIYALPSEQSEKTLRSLRTHLIVDFVFMPGIYGAIFFACFKTSEKMLSFGEQVFIWLALLQAIAWVLDIVENSYLLKKIKPSVVPSSQQMHKTYQWMEVVKWGIALTGAVCSVSALLYFWLIGNYKIESLSYLVVLAIEVVIAFMVSKFFVRSKVEECTT